MHQARRSCARRAAGRWPKPALDDASLVAPTASSCPGGARPAPSWLPQHPRLAAAALARCGADPPCDPGRRRQTGITIIADGRRPGHRPDADETHRTHRRTTPPAASTTASPGSAAMIVEALEALPRGARRDAPAGRRGHLRRQDRQAEAGIDWTRRPPRSNGRSAPSIPSPAPSQPMAKPRSSCGAPVPSTPAARRAKCCWPKAPASSSPAAKALCVTELQNPAANACRRRLPARHADCRGQRASTCAGQPLNFRHSPHLIFRFPRKSRKDG